MTQANNSLVLLRDWLRQFGYYFSYLSTSWAELDTIYIGFNGRWLGFVVRRSKVFEVFPYNPGGARLPVGEIEIAAPNSFEFVHGLLETSLKQRRKA